MKLLAGPATPAGRIRPLLAVAAVLVAGLVFMAPDGPAGPPAGESPAPARTSAATGGSKASTPPGLPARAAAAEEFVNVFASHSWYVPPPPRPAPPPAAAPRPTAPPLPFTFLGSYVEAGAAQVYYLVKGDRVYDVKIGDVVDNTYRIEAVEGESLVLTFLPLNQRQTLGIGG